MRQKSSPPETPSERLVRDIRRATRKQYSAEEKIRIVLDSLHRNVSSISERKQTNDATRISPMRGNSISVTMYSVTPSAAENVTFWILFCDLDAAMERPAESEPPSATPNNTRLETLEGMTPIGAAPQRRRLKAHIQ